jgi:D-aminopeptidase
VNPASAQLATPSGRPRARALGIPFAGVPGPRNDITDIAGAEVGFVTLREDVARGRAAPAAVRTGVTAVFPRGRERAGAAVLAGYARLNGNGELTGTAWVREHGWFTGPVVLTNTNSVGAARDTTARWLLDRFPMLGVIPVVGETWDGLLNDINGFHVTSEHVRMALDGARAEPIEQGSVGGGTGMVCYELKGGTGSASRAVAAATGEWTVGVLLQTNFGNRRQLTIAGVPMWPHLREGLIWGRDHGSVIAVVLTDAPLLGGQLERLARRVGLGLARTGAIGGAESGDLFLAASTANDGVVETPGVRSFAVLHDDEMDPLLAGVVYATEEAVLDSLVVNEPMTGAGGREVMALPHARVVELLRQHRVVP